MYFELSRYFYFWLSFSSRSIGYQISHFPMCIFRYFNCWTKNSLFKFMKCVYFASKFFVNIYDFFFCLCAGVDQTKKDNKKKNSWNWSSCNGIIHRSIMADVLSFFTFHATHHVYCWLVYTNTHFLLLRFFNSEKDTPHTIIRQFLRSRNFRLVPNSNSVSLICAIYLPSAESVFMQSANLLLLQFVNNLEYSGIDTKSTSKFVSVWTVHLFCI